MNLFQRASNPEQYDKEMAYWEQEKPWRDFYKTHILPSPEKIAGKEILDIGSGTGWLLQDLISEGATRVVGVEPSQKNVDHARERYSNVSTIFSSFEEYSDEEMYDYIFAIMSFVHLADVHVVMNKVKKLLKKGGSFRMIVPDFEYAKTSRFGYDLEIESINENEYVARAGRPTVSTIDIVRKKEVYEKAALRSGLNLEKSEPLMPTSELIKEKPHYEKFKNTAIAQMLWFSN